MAPLYCMSLVQTCTGLQSTKYLKLFMRHSKDMKSCRSSVTEVKKNCGKQLLIFQGSTAHSLSRELDRRPLDLGMINSNLKWKGQKYIETIVFFIEFLQSRSSAVYFSKMITSFKALYIGKLSLPADVIQFSWLYLFIVELMVQTSSSLLAKNVSSFTRFLQ